MITHIKPYGIPHLDKAQNIPERTESQYIISFFQQIDSMKESLNKETF